MKYFALIAMILACAPTVASGKPSTPRIADWNKSLAGPPTKVMVLGTTHLAGLPKDFRPERLKPLLDRLAAFKPDIIAIEALSGADCDMLVRYAAIYPGTADQYCASTDAASKATGLDVPTAVAKVKSALVAWPAAPTPADRRRLAALFSAANDRSSALVQWLRLPEAERHAGDGLDSALVDELNQRKSRMNENYAIAAALAARLGLERVHPVDDHSADSVTADLGPDFEKAITAVWHAAGKSLSDYRKKLDAPAEDQSIIDWYRFINDPKSLKNNIDADFGAALKDKAAPYYGRQYVAWWETRNLRMVANLRSSFGNNPGARVLAIVGSSHKPYYDTYLGMMHEVQLVDPLDVIK
ncbi:DUF5694 domain-containing protein [Aquisediminimonas profunda]|uniref:DUF5694 domain-containing protein n=1 Tax=Aquisediminimonas profunda TaxID=1550733 RepID=UPI001FE66C97|nr:DUF5694 domain-containing protein [Aquisediminimonas profunda]